MRNSAKRIYYPNMVILRYIFALCIIIYHIDVLAGYNIWTPLTTLDAVGGFFTMSGYLIYPGFINNPKLKQFFLDRCRRILPAYFFIVIACALGFVAISTFPIAEYYFSKGFWEYLGANFSFLNWLHPVLPGVFTGNEFVEPSVNGSLWSMKVLWCFYFSIPIFIWVSNKIKFKKEWLAICIIILSIVCRILFFIIYDTTGREIYRVIYMQIFGELTYFYSGILIYFYRRQICRHKLMWGIIGGVLWILLRIHYHPIAQAFSPLGFSLLIMAISMVGIENNTARKIPDYSYCLYLFHYPIIQLSILWGFNRLTALPEVLIVILPTFLLSYLFTKGYKIIRS